MLKISPHKSNKAIKAKLKRLPDDIRRGANKGLISIRKKLKPAAKNSFKEEKTGRVYTIYVGRGGRRLKKPKLHTASAPGETPAIMTGALGKSLGYKLKNGKILTFGASTPYARRHELENNRSYLRRTIDEHKRDIKRDLYREIEKQVTRMG